MSRRSATIVEVAAAAGVSTATVSRTLSNPAIVTDTTRQAVMRAVESTGYRADPLARNFRRRRTDTVIALVPNLANPFFSEILAGLSSTLTGAGRGLLIADTQVGPAADDRLAQYFASGITDGVILFDGTLSPERLTRPGRPPVIMACEWMSADLPSVRVDNAQGAALAVAHLAALGHRHIGHVTGPRGNVLTEARLSGWQDAMDAAGLARRPDRIFEGDFGLDSGARALRDWIDRPDRPTALFFASDVMAIGFLAEARRRGISAPRDVSVVGFDDVEASAHVDPAITTIRQPRRTLGERAARMLLDLLDAGGGGGAGVGAEAAPDAVTLPVDLVVRDSTAPPPTG